MSQAPCRFGVGIATRSAVLTELGRTGPQCVDLGIHPTARHARRGQPCRGGMKSSVRSWRRWLRRTGARQRQRIRHPRRRVVVARRRSRAVHRRGCAGRRIRGVSNPLRGPDAAACGRGTRRRSRAQERHLANRSSDECGEARSTVSRHQLPLFGKGVSDSPACWRATGTGQVARAAFSRRLTRAARRRS